jgi:hypothetical protein
MEYFFLFFDYKVYEIIRRGLVRMVLEEALCDRF